MYTYIIYETVQKYTNWYVHESQLNSNVQYEKWNIKILHVEMNKIIQVSERKKI